MRQWEAQPKELAGRQRIILNISASPYWQGKPEVREKMLAALAERHGAYVAMVNQVGGNDGLVFDGSSVVIRPDGQVVARAASFAEDRIETCLFVGPARDAGDWNVVKNLFAADRLSDSQRRMLLSGKSTDGLASAGPIVCACFGVGRTAICDAIVAGAGTAAEIGAQLKAGTNCGSCIPELKRLIAQTSVTGGGKRQLARVAN